MQQSARCSSNAAEYLLDSLGFRTPYKLYQLGRDLSLPRLMRFMPQSIEFRADIVVRGFHRREAGGIFTGNRLDDGLCQQCEDILAQQVLVEPGWVEIVERRLARLPGLKRCNVNRQ
jgi:hypothetical protein